MLKIQQKWRLVGKLRIFKDMDFIALEKEKIDPQLETKMPNRKSRKMKYRTV